MREISSNNVREFLERHISTGCHVDGRLFREIARPGKIFVVSLRTADDFLSLVWQSIDAARPLVPVGSPRTLQDCASRLGQFGWRFRALVEVGYDWFEECIAIDESFDYSKLGWIAVTPLVEGERQESPDGSYYIYDGVHKSIVLAKKILRSELEYRSLEALLLTPRRL